MKVFYDKSRANPALRFSYMRYWYENRKISFKKMFTIQ